MPKEDYLCPFCHSHISKEQYDKVIRENELLKKKIDTLEKERTTFQEKVKKFEEEKKIMQKQMQDKLNAELAKQKQKISGEMVKYQDQIKKFKEKEAQHKQDLVNVKLKEQLKFAEETKKLNLKIKQLEEGKSASESGFDFEKDLFGILLKEFAGDEVIKTGKMGDIIIKVKDKSKIIGTLLIELKRVTKHLSTHIEEVKRHKIDAQADVGILVTNGDFGKIKMDGFKNIDDVLVIRPNSAIDFIKLLRAHLKEINNLKISLQQKENERAKLWDFIHSIEFETQMNSILRDINLFKDLDTKETKLITERDKIEEHLLLAYNIIKEGIAKTKKI